MYNNIIYYGICSGVGIIDISQNLVVADKFHKKEEEQCIAKNIENTINLIDSDRKFTVRPDIYVSWACERL